MLSAMTEPAGPLGGGTPRRAQRHSANELIMVENFAEELRRRVPN